MDERPTFPRAPAPAGEGAPGRRAALASGLPLVLAAFASAA